FPKATRFFDFLPRPGGGWVGHTERLPTQPVSADSGGSPPGRSNQILVHAFPETSAGKGCSESRSFSANGRQGRLGRLNTLHKVCFAVLFLRSCSCGPQPPSERRAPALRTSGLRRAELELRAPLLLPRPVPEMQFTGVVA